jgi:hypothetical protein
MKLADFLQFARAELSLIDHPYAPEIQEHLHKVDVLTRVVDRILASGDQRFEALDGNFYEALGGYLTARRHRKAGLRIAIAQLAINFESYLRTLVQKFVPDRDCGLASASGVSRGKLSTSGYVGDFVRDLFGIDVKVGEKGESYWKSQSVEATCYHVCFKHQLSGKHEAREYSLDQLERLARHVLASYLFAARWLVLHSSVESDIDATRDALSRNAVFHWPAILNHQLSELRFGPEDSDLVQSLDQLQDLVGKLMAETGEIESTSAEPTSPAYRDFLVRIEAAAEEYEMLVSESNMREWGREQEYQ